MSQIDIFDEIIVDNFAGGGGASTGIELAAGRPVTVAINHDPDAILLHKRNHPYTTHYQESVWDIDPVKVCQGRPVGLAWFSPDCKHFSKAKGAALVDRNIRGLAWVVLRWAATVKPRVIMLENVEEFQTWGPVRKGKPVKKQAGRTFRKWKYQLMGLGYKIEHRELVAADYGAPTTRKRFVLVARCDGKPIEWPKRTHAPKDHPLVKAGKLLPWRSAADIIDWSIPGYSIFESKEAIKEQHGATVVRPLANNTMRRVIRGVDKFTIKSGKPFIVPTGYGERDGQQPRVNDVQEPLGTVVSTVKHNICQPVIAPITFPNTGGSVGGSVVSPINTVRTSGGIALSMPTLMAIGQTSGGDRCRDVQDPTHTQVSKAEECLVSAQLIQYHTEQNDFVRAQGLAAPINTVDAANRYGLASAQLVEYYGNGNPLDATEPMHTVTAHDREAVVAAHLDKYFAGGYKGCGDSADAPLSTITVEPRHGVATAHIAEFKGQDIGQSAYSPLRTITASAGEFATVQTKIVKYAPGRDLKHWPKIRELLNTYCGYKLAEDEVMLLIMDGIAWYIADISLRMLTPRELYNAMGFPVDYIIDRDCNGKEYPKSKQVARCGNAVCPPLAEAMVRANFPEWCNKQLRTMAELEDAIAV